LKKKIETLHQLRDDIEESIKFLGSDRPDVSPHELNISTLNKMWKPFVESAVLKEELVKQRMDQDTAHYCFFKNVHTFFEDVKKAKSFIDDREERIKKEKKAQSALESRRTLTNVKIVQKTVLEEKKPESQATRQMTIRNPTIRVQPSLASRQPTVRQPTPIRQPTAIRPTAIRQPTTIRPIAIRQPTLRPGGLLAPSPPNASRTQSTAHRWMTNNPYLKPT